MIIKLSNFVIIKLSNFKAKSVLYIIEKDNMRYKTFSEVMLFSIWTPQYAAYISAFLSHVFVNMIHSWF